MNKNEIKVEKILIIKKWYWMIDKNRIKENE
jgi:hypothetical protein